MIKFRASGVAAVCGLHKYKKVSEELSEWVLRINRKQDTEGLSTKKDRCVEIVKEAILPFQDIQLSLDTGTASESQLLQVLPDEYRNVPEVVNEVSRVVNCTYGTAGEASILKDIKADNVKSEYGIYVGSNYTIIGISDGVRGDQVVEVKNRKRIWATPPNYDIIQLRVYLKIYKKSTGVLVEKHPDGSVRETIVIDDEDEWKKINIKLTRMAIQIKSMTIEDIKAIYAEC